MDERARRLWAGTEADALGWGGVVTVARATGLAIGTVRKGRDEVRAGAHGRRRRPSSPRGGGRGAFKVDRPMPGRAWRSWSMRSREECGIAAAFDLSYQGTRVPSPVSVRPTPPCRRERESGTVRSRWVADQQARRRPSGEDGLRLGTRAA